jgi:hypothetical protein
MQQAEKLDLRQLTEGGVAALNAGDWRRARELFERLATAGPPSAPAWLGLAYACRGLKDDAALLAAIDKALALDPANLRALILKADHCDATGDARAASSYYVHALKAAPPDDQLPPDLRSELTRAQAVVERHAAQIESGVRQRLAGEGFGSSNSRVAESVDILFGKKAIYVQRPRYYYFPGLPQIQFYGRAEFPWLARLEAATAQIRAELVEVMKQDAAAFKPYIQSDPRRPQKSQDGMTDNPDWSAFYLWRNGEVVAENAARCPRTMSALADLPLARIRSRSPSALFSLLRPGAKIPPHNGFVNTRLICHLPLIVPGGCEFRVGNETREWVEGQAWLFDDTIEHEAVNRSDHTRVVLLFEVWRPELSDEERRGVAAMFEAIDAQGGGTVWEI